jgi:hypothetical protein
MSLPNVPFFEYPRLWSDDREEFLSIIDSVSSAGGFILQKAVLDSVVSVEGNDITIIASGHASLLAREAAQYLTSQTDLSKKLTSLINQGEFIPSAWVNRSYF